MHLRRMKLQASERWKQHIAEAQPELGTENADHRTSGNRCSLK